MSNLTSTGTDPEAEETLYKQLDAERVRRKRAVIELNTTFEYFDLGVRSYPYPKLVTGTCKRYLAFLDLLGFSNIIDRNDNSTIDKLLDKLIGEIQISIASNSRRYVTVDTDGGFSPDLDKARVNSIVFSDTILFWSNDASPDSFKSIVDAVSTFLNNAVIFRSWAVRGSITFGDLAYSSYDIANRNFLINQSSLYGKSIIDGYKLEESQEWIGCVVSSEAIENFLKSDDSSEEYLEKKLLKYDVPLKGGEVLDQSYVIWWGWAQDADKNVERFFTKLANLESVPDVVQAKYINTCKFLKYSREMMIARYPD